MFSIQAVAISTRFAHNIGFSDTVTNLLTAVTGLAQAIGLHRIAFDATDTADHQQTKNSWHESIEREIGKRTWWQLVIQDYFAIPFTERYSMFARHGHSTQPLTLAPRNTPKTFQHPIPHQLP